MRTVINKLSIRIVLSLAFLIILLVTVGLTGYLSFRNGQNAVNEMAGQLHQEEANHIQVYLDNYLGMPHLINQLNLDLIQQGVLNVQDLDELEHHFMTQILHFTPVISIAYADEQKNYIGVTTNLQGYAKSIEISTKTTGYTLEGYGLDGQGNRSKQVAIIPNYDPRMRPWYQAAVHAGKETWTPVYTWSSGQVGLDAVAPVFDKNGSFLGVLDTSLTLDSIGGFLHSLPDKYQGQTFIIERSGLLVASSTNDELYTTVGNVLNRLFAFQSSDPIIRLATQYLQNQPGKLDSIRTGEQFYFTSGNERQFAQVTPYHDQYGLDWLIVTVIPESTFMGQIDANNRITIGLILVSLLVSFFISNQISRWVVQPIDQLNQFSEALAQGDWSHKVVTRRKDEIGHLVRSFNNMADQLQASFTLVQLNEARYHTLFEDSPTALLEADFSKLKKYFDDLQSTGMSGWKTYFEDHPDVVHNCAEMIVIKDINKTTLKTLEAEKKEDLLTNLTPILSEKSYGLFINVLVTLAKGQKYIEMEILHQTLKGKEIDVFCRLSVVAGYEDTWSKVFVSLVDITLNKRTEEQMRKLSRAVEQSPASIVITDTNGAIEYVNPKFTELTYYSIEEVLGRNSRILKSNWTSPEEYVRLWSTITSGREWQGEFCNRKKNGELYWEMASISPIFNDKGKITHFIGVKEDISERKRVESELIESEHRYHSVVDQAQEGIMLLDEDGHILTWNRALQKITDIADEDVLGKFIWDVQYQLLMKDQNKKLPYDVFKASVINALERGHSTWIDGIHKQTFTHSDGSHTIIEGHNSVIRTAKGNMIVGVFQDVTKSKYSEISLQRYNNRVEIMHKIDKSILASHSPEQIANSTLEGLKTLIPNVDFEILQFDLSTRQILRLAKLINKLQIVDYSPMKWEHVEKLHQGEPLFIKKYTEKISLMSMPLQVKGELTGALNLYGDETEFHNPDHLVITQEIADIIAIAIQQSQLQQETQKANIDLLHAYDTTIEGWAKALEMRERETAGHSKRVVYLTLAIAKALEIKAEEMIHIQRGALLHDIGKLGIPDSILMKPGPLTDDEWKIMRQHPFFAYELLSQIPYLLPALDIPYCHHEKWDGSGYPRGLKREEIPLSARIFAVADVWDALLFKRPYSSGWREEDVIHYIIEKSGTQFDPAVIEAFVRLRKEKFEQYTGIIR